MLTLKKIPDVAIDVPIDVPGDNGKTTKSSITVRYRLLSVTERDEVQGRDKDSDVDDDTILRRDIINITNIKDASGKSIDFSDEVLTQMLDITYIRSSLIDGWNNVQFNRAGHAEKN